MLTRQTHTIAFLPNFVLFIHLIFHLRLTTLIGHRSDQTYLGFLTFFLEAGEVG